MPTALPDDGLPRSSWADSSPMMREYYDHEWGCPVTSEAGLYERLCLEGFQAGLSWATILGRRDRFRAAFAGFDPEAVAEFGEPEVAGLLQDSGIIRSEAKIRSAIGNARATLALREEGSSGQQHQPLEIPRTDGTVLRIPGGLPSFLWSRAPLQTPVPHSAAEVPTQSPESQALAKDLKAHGFRFIGPTTAYALMEATGMVDTHWTGSHRRGVSGLFGPDGRRALARPAGQ